MFIKLFLLFTLLPLLELSILFKLGQHFGFFPSLVLVIGTGALGATIAKKEGIQVINKIKRELANGTMPAHHLWDALLLLIAGITLVTPGVITDIFGITLLLPGIRSQILKQITSHLPKPTENKSNFKNAEPTTFETIE